MEEIKEFISELMSMERDMDMENKSTTYFIKPVMRENLKTICHVDKVNYKLSMTVKSLTPKKVYGKVVVGYHKR